MKRIGIITFIVLLYSLSGFCQTLFLSPSGNDSNSGTKGNPLASLKGARDKIRELRRNKQLTDTVFVRIEGGTYQMSEPLELTVEDTGTEKSPVVFIAEPENRAVFCGGMRIEHFQQVEPGLWKCFVPETAKYGFYFEQLYVNGERRYRAQTPNHGSFFRVKDLKQTVLDSTGSRSASFASQKILLHEENKSILHDIVKENRDDMLVVFYHNWDVTRKRILHVNTRDTEFYIGGEGMKPWNPINKDSRYVVENYRGALDAPGEWFLQRDGWLYYIPMPGETPDNINCIAPVAKQFLVINGSESKHVQHIRFENMNFEVAGYQTPANGNEPVQSAATVEATVMADFADYIEFQNCEITHTGLHAIWFRNQCSYDKVEHCHLHDLGGGGVKIGTTDLMSDDKTTHHIVVDNNIIQHGSFVFPCSAGTIIFNGSDNKITHNDIGDFRNSSVSVGWIWGYAHSPSKRNEIAYNHLHHLGWGELCDMGGVYTLGASEGTTVHNNHIHHIYSFNYGGWGLYTDEGSYKVIMENNLVYACKNSGFHQHYGKDNIIRNNIFAFNTLSQLQLTRPEEHLSFNFTNNIIYYDRGTLFQSNGSDSWLKAQVNIDYNCYWNTKTATPDFHKLTFAEWKKMGRDIHSVIADPLFVNPEKQDFRFRNPSVIKKIKFKPFDYSQAGVYGEAEWLEKAKMSEELLQQFDEIVKRMEKL
jgi:hypothetical protein